MKRIFLFCCVTLAGFLYSCNNDESSKRYNGKDSTGKKTYDVVPGSNQEGKQPENGTDTIRSAKMDANKE
jgi:hypothetical protein